MSICTRTRARVAKAIGFWRASSILLQTGLLLMLCGCITADQLPVEIPIPGLYKAAPRAPTSAPPALDWWRGFRSKELTSLIEEAQTANFDIAAAVARIIEADAQSKVAGAPLLPTINYTSSAIRSRSSQAGGSNVVSGSSAGSERSVYTMALNASYEIDFWGKNRA